VTLTFEVNFDPVDFEPLTLSDIIDIPFRDRSHVPSIPHRCIKEFGFDDAIWPAASGLDGISPRRLVP